MLCKLQIKKNAQVASAFLSKYALNENTMICMGDYDFFCHQIDKMLISKI